MIIKMINFNTSVIAPFPFPSRSNIVRFYSINFRYFSSISLPPFPPTPTNFSASSLSFPFISLYSLSHPLSQPLSHHRGNFRFYSTDFRYFSSMSGKKSSTNYNSEDTNIFILSSIHSKNKGRPSSPNCFKWECNMNFPKVFWSHYRGGNRFLEFSYFLVLCSKGEKTFQK